MSSKLEQLKAMTTVVADTGDIQAIRQYQPEDATTNPSLLLKAASLPEYQLHLQHSLKEAEGTGQERLADAAERFAVRIGREILNIIPGLVSTEVDAHLSFNSTATVNKARRIIQLYEQQGVDRARVLIKIASTWEGIQAARTLEKEGIRCNLTLLFTFAQAVAAACAGATLISPFVGRILDWYRTRNPQENYSGQNDPGVQSVTRIYRYYKQHDYPTIVMGASFRNTGEIEALAGCDRLTISPALLDALQQDTGALPRVLLPSTTENAEPRLILDEKTFRWMLNEDAMATEKLADGIRSFAKDQIALEEMLRQQP